jgi:hypothetical protein
MRKSSHLRWLSPFLAVAEKGGVEGAGLGPDSADGLLPHMSGKAVRET